VAYAQREDLEGDFTKTSREGFRIAHDVSAYSLVALTRAALPLLERSAGASVIAMTYYGSEKVARGYNVMGVAKAALEAAVRYLAADLGPRGIRVNAISAGPVNTLAARGIRGFTEILRHHADKAPLRRNVEPREIGDAALFLASPLSSGITGEVIFVDGGYHIMAV
jgi:enoyl-[acyl-carrier protein] reductase I